MPASRRVVTRSASPRSRPQHIRPPARQAPGASGAGDAQTKSGGCVMRGRTMGIAAALLAVALLTMLGLVAAGCGGSDEPSGDATGAASGEPDQGRRDRLAHRHLRRPRRGREERHRHGSEAHQRRRRHQRPPARGHHRGRRHRRGQGRRRGHQAHRAGQGRRHHRRHRHRPDRWPCAATCSAPASRRSPWPAAPPSPTPWTRWCSPPRGPTPSSCPSRSQYLKDQGITKIGLISDSGGFGKDGQAVLTAEAPRLRRRDRRRRDASTPVTPT